MKCFFIFFLSILSLDRSLCQAMPADPLSGTRVWDHFSVVDYSETVYSHYFILGLHHVPMWKLCLQSHAAVVFHPLAEPQKAGSCVQC